MQKGDKVRFSRDTWFKSGTFKEMRNGKAMIQDNLIPVTYEVSLENIRIWNKKEKRWLNV